VSFLNFRLALLLLFLLFPACLPIQKSQQEEIAIQPVPISGTSIIDLGRVRLVEVPSEKQDFVILGEAFSVVGPERCLDFFLMDLGEFAEYHAARIVPDRMSRISLPSESEPWRYEFQAMAGVAAVALVPRSCGESGPPSSTQLAHSVYFELGGDQRPSSLSGDLTVTVNRRDPVSGGTLSSVAMDYDVEVTDSEGKRMSKPSCWLSTGRPECLPLTFQDLAGPFTVSVTPKREGARFFTCDAPESEQVRREGESCVLTVKGAVIAPTLTTMPKGDFVDIRFLRPEKMSSAVKYRITYQDTNWDSCLLSTGRLRCEQPLRIPTGLPFSAIVVPIANPLATIQPTGLTMRQCLLKRGEGTATLLPDGTCRLDLRSPYAEVFARTWSD